MKDRKQMKYIISGAFDFHEEDRESAEKWLTDSLKKLLDSDEVTIQEDLLPIDRKHDFSIIVEAVTVIDPDEHQ